MLFPVSAQNSFENENLCCTISSTLSVLHHNHFGSCMLSCFLVVSAFLAVSRYSTFPLSSPFRFSRRFRFLAVSQPACCGRSNQTNTPMFEIRTYWPRHATSGCLVVGSFVEEHFRNETRDRLLCTISSHSAFCIITILDVAC